MSSLPWPPSSSLCRLRLVATIAPLSSALCMIRSPLILGQPSWLVEATAAAPGSIRTTLPKRVSLRTIGPSLLAPQPLRLRLVEGELAGRRAVVVVIARRAPAADRRRLGGGRGRRRRGQRRLRAMGRAQTCARVGEEPRGDEGDEEPPRDADRVAAAGRAVDDAEEEQERGPHAGGEDHRAVAAGE